MRINFNLAILLLIFFYLIYPSVLLLLLKRKRILKIIGMVSFILYLIFLSLLVFGKITINQDFVNIEIIKSSDWFKMNFLVASFDKMNLIYNLIMLFPVSAFVFSISNKKTFLLTIVVSFLISFSIETFQFILPVNRTTELLDLLTNTLSGIIGYLYFSILIKFSNKRVKQD